MKNCAKCNEELDNNRKKYCSDFCKYWYNLIKKENEKHLPPVKKRNRNYFSMVVGSEWAKGGSRQGRRAGGMIMGAMAAMVRCTREEIVEVTRDNILRHLAGITGHIPKGITLGDGTFIDKNHIHQELGICITP